MRTAVPRIWRVEERSAPWRRVSSGSNNILGEMCMTEQELEQRSRRSEVGYLTALICGDGPLFADLMPEQRPPDAPQDREVCERPL